MPTIESTPVPQPPVVVAPVVIPKPEPAPIIQDQKLISLVKPPVDTTAPVNVDVLTEEQRKKMRAERFGSSSVTVAMAA